MKKIFWFFLLSAYITFFLVGSFLIFKSPKISFAAGKASYLGKYPMKDRFGVGLWSNNQKTIDNYKWDKLGIGWYLDWSNGLNSSLGGARKGLAYFPIVGATSGYPTSQMCNDIRVNVVGNPNKYPPGAWWLVGDGIGLIDNRSPEAYASEFVAWRDCLKSIDSSFLVGTGGLPSFWHDTYPNKQSVCVSDINHSRSGKTYFTSYLNSIPIDKKPDFINNHVNTECVANGSQYDKFRQIITEYRQVMKDLDLQDKDLVIKLFGLRNVNSTFADRQNFMKQSVTYLAETKDNNLGNRQDEGRLVQKWAWFILNDNNNPPMGWDRTTALVNNNNGEFTPLGDLYKELIKKYVVAPATSDVRFGLGGTIDGATTLGVGSMRAWGGGDNGGEKGFINNGIETFFTAGKIDNYGYTSKNGSLTDGHPKCIRPGHNNEVVSCVDYATEPNLRPNELSFDEIAATARNYPGQIWEISNEPDWHPYVIAKDYAVWFRLYSQEILRHDPTAKIMNGAFITSVIDKFYDDWFKRGPKCQRDPEYCNANDKFAYVRLFRDHYRQFYGDYPQVDVWDIHPYALLINRLPEPLSTTSGKIMYFKDRLEQLESSTLRSEKNKPLYMTEFGVVASSEGSIAREIPCETHGCLSQQEQETEWNTVANYMRNITSWLKNTDNLAYAQKWFWYYWGPEYQWTTVNGLDIIDNFVNQNLTNFPSTFRNAAEPFPLAIEYAKQAQISKLFNKSFETYYVSGAPYGNWRIDPNSIATYRSSQAYAHSGNSSLQIINGNRSPSTIFQQVNTTGFNGKNINLKVWCKTENNGLGAIRSTVITSTGQTQILRQSGFTSCPNWTEIQTGSTFVPLDAVSLKVELLNHGANSIIYFDDVEILNNN